MYDFQDKDGHRKLLKILDRLKENGFRAEMSNNKMFVILYNQVGEEICAAYCSSWHNTGLIKVKHLTKEIGNTYSPDEAYDLLVNYYKENVKTTFKKH